MRVENLDNSTIQDTIKHLPILSSEPKLDSAAEDSVEKMDEDDSDYLVTSS